MGGDRDAGGDWLRQIRESAGLTLDELAARIPYSKSSLGMYETGRRKIPDDLEQYYVRECWQVEQYTTDPVTVAIMLGRMDVDRRSFLRTAAYSVALSATGLVAAPELVRLATATDSSLVGMGEVHAVQRVTDAFHHLDEVRGGGFGRTAVAEFLATDVAALLRSRFADDRVRAEMFSAAAELAYLAAFKSHDEGLDGLAQRYWLAALRMAEREGLPGHDAWILRILALQSTDIQRPDFSPDLAEAALSRARGRLGPDATALLTVAVARCHAETGNRGAARAALRAAEPWTGPELTSEQPRWVQAWCPNKGTLADQTAHAFRALGDLRNAERYYALGQSLWNPDTHARVWALTGAETGLTRWALGDHTGAENLWAAATPVLAQVDSARARGALERIRAAAADPPPVP